MTNSFSFSKKQIGLAISSTLALGFAATMAMAETGQTDKGYLTDPRDTVVRNNYGECWRTGTGPVQAFRAECGPKPTAVPIARVVEPVQQPVAKAPEPIVAAAPEPAPVVAVVAPKPAPKPIERAALDADALFDFNKSSLRPAGRVALDNFADKLVDIAAETITVTGYTDRLGSTHYNQRLSEQRAKAVKTYLISKGIEPNRIHTEGKGEMQPVTKAGECKGAKSAKVIACLQPDRRVEIEVRGTRIAR